MILLINGAFGIGKTTVSRLLKRQIDGSRLYDPEWAGSVLMRLPFIKLEGAGTDDFQDINLWRKSVVRGTKLFRALSRETPAVVLIQPASDPASKTAAGVPASTPGVGSATGQ